MEESESLRYPDLGSQCADQRFSRPPLRTVNPLIPEADMIAWAASCVLRGGVVIYPTETFYGLGGDPKRLAVVERIFRIKQRDPHKPLPLIAADAYAVREVVADWPHVAELLARTFWPGPLTMVLTAAAWLPPELHAHTGKIAIRISSHAVAQRLAAAAGGVLISTSANPAGLPPCTDPDKLPRELVMQVDGLLHAGLTPGGEPSTLVDVTMQPPQLLRQGAVNWERIRELLS